ncbi:conserved hypothetical protein [Acidithiobacillus caldus SM-1]|uniref:Uncharacterized protein n=1 Tax=Acidithiobacillus caldus (strain SM-1) TaxID=990288 RepID=F9ZR32_ACICS|nr:conserved hypothetical protein [Acidithiobacillus caldus SM-1]
MYRFPCPASLFPRFETWFLFLGWGLKVQVFVCPQCREVSFKYRGGL